ncbi:MAG TPA: serine protease [Spirochaetia bacterium]|nr:serine protease [Spirochaetia bacterium]
MKTVSVKTLALVAFSFIAVFPAMAKNSPTPSRTLRPGVAYSDVVQVFGPESRVTKLGFDVPPDAYAVEFSIQGSVADLDIVISDEFGDVIAIAEELDFNESIFLSRIGDPALVTGPLTVEVIYQLAAAPVIDGRTIRELPFSLLARVVDVGEPEPLVPGRVINARLLPGRGMMQVYEVDVPVAAGALRVDIADTDGDLDIFVHPGRPPADPHAYAYSSQTVRSTESLVVLPTGAPPLTSGRYSIMILDQISLDAPVEYSLLVSLQSEPPASLVGIEALPRARGPLERSLLATVEISIPDGGGSGVIVSDDGYLLTNWHVVEGPDGNPSGDIMIGVSVDHTRPPAERFRAEVVAYAPDRDLALLRITSGRYGAAIPPGYRFPTVEMRTSPLVIAEDLQFIGYPWIGGTGSRASITYTRGTVAGFQRTGFGLLVKSDGEINAGNSGGAALDRAFRLIGLPTSVVGENAGQLAYVVPMSAIPDAWHEIIGRSKNE